MSYKKNYGPIILKEIEKTVDLTGQFTVVGHGWIASTIIKNSEEIYMEVYPRGYRRPFWEIKAKTKDFTSFLDGNTIKTSSSLALIRIFCKPMIDDKIRLEENKEKENE